MIRINLLPHREEARRNRRQQFYVLAALVLIVGLVLALAVHTILVARVDRQQSNNDFLRSEIASLDKDIAEIKRLKEQTNALLSRKQVIELLQSHRAETVHIMNEMARQLPDGVFLKSVKQKGLEITLTGYSQSNARVSTLMRNLDGSPVLEKPTLVIIKSPDPKDVDKRVPAGRQVYLFELKVQIERAAAPDEKAEAPGAGKLGEKP